MIQTPTSFTYEYLSSMKFKELQKLSVQFHVNKRWAKKQELIENLLALKGKEETSDNQDEGNEWRDGSTVFNDLQQSKENEENRRLTMTMVGHDKRHVNTKSSVEHTDSHLTFEVPQNGRNLLGETTNSRETYSLGVTDLGVEPLTESRATFEIPPKKKLVEEVDPRATYDIPQNGKKLLEESEMALLQEEKTKKLKKNSEVNRKEVGMLNVRQNLGNASFGINIKDGEFGNKGKGKVQMKTLTIPCARVTRRTRKDGETSKTDNSPIKMSKKSINIKKSTRLPLNKNELIKSPAFSSKKNSLKKQKLVQALAKSQSGKITQSRVPVRLLFTGEVKPNDETSEENEKENVERDGLRKRISKIEDDTLGGKGNLAKVNFRTPPPSVSKGSKAMPAKKTPLRKEADGRLNKNAAAATPGVKSTVKLISVTKMPDFSKIHKRHFEQMDSLHDHLRKKEERIRKLFGTPQPGQQLQVHNKSTPVFRFQSTAVEKEKKGVEILKRMTTPVKKEKDSTAAQKEAFKSKLPPLKLRTDIKDKNRSHIHGVRTNKRFELQMKFRNI